MVKPDADGQKASDIYGFVIDVIYIVTGAQVTIGWAVIGLYFWIPLLARTTILFTAYVTYATLVGGADQVEHGRRALDAAIRFYIDGFMSIRAALEKRGAAEEIIPPRASVNWQRVVFETVWALVVWGIMVAALFGVLTSSNDSGPRVEP